MLCSRSLQVIHSKHGSVRTTASLSDGWWSLGLLCCWQEIPTGELSHRLGLARTSGEMEAPLGGGDGGGGDGGEGEVAGRGWRGSHAGRWWSRSTFCMDAALGAGWLISPSVLTQDPRGRPFCPPHFTGRDRQGQWWQDIKQAGLPPLAAPGQDGHCPGRSEKGASFLPTARGPGLGLLPLFLPGSFPSGGVWCQLRAGVWSQMACGLV